MTGQRRLAWNSTLPARTEPIKRGAGLPPGTALRRSKGLGPGTWDPRAVMPRQAGSGQRPKARRNTGPDGKTRALVLMRDGFACVCCGVSVLGKRYSLQHRKRRSQGGDNRPSNLVTVLGSGTEGCHERIDSRRDPHDEAKGYTVRSHDDPRMIPVMYFSPDGSGVLMWLDDEGGISPDAPRGGEAA